MDLLTDLKLTPELISAPNILYHLTASEFDWQLSEHKTIRAWVGTSIKFPIIRRMVVSRQSWILAISPHIYTPADLKQQLDRKYEKKDVFPDIVWFDGESYDVVNNPKFLDLLLRHPVTRDKRNYYWGRKSSS